MQDGIGRTALFNACYHGRLDVVRDLLDFKNNVPNKLDINIAENGGRTPLHAAIAASRNSKEIVNLLLKQSELNLNVEARPSSRANRYLLKLLKRNHNSASIPVIGQDVLLSINNQQSVYPISPPITCSPLESPYSDDLDLMMGVLKSKTRNTDSPISPRISKNQTFISTLSSQSRPTTPTTPPSTPPTNSVVAVYQSDNGRLAVTNSSKEENSGFNKMSITPLAEACIFHSKEIVEQLLLHGAIDKNALASQICSLIRQSELLIMILSRQCSLVDNDHDDEQTNNDYCLQWNSKHLQTIKGAWLAKDKSCFLSCVHEQDQDTSGVLCRPVSYKSIDYTSILQVSLNHNHLINVPLELFQLPFVKTIDLSENNLMTLPEPSDKTNTWSCDNLMTLNLSGNSLTVLPSCLWTLPSLVQVSARKNKLQQLMTGYDPSQDGRLSSTLLEINLSSNELEFIPDFIFMFPHVTKISLPYNNLTFLPKSMWDQQSLQDLNISNNNLDCLPFCETDELNSFGTSHDDGTGILDIARPLNDLNTTLVVDSSIQAQPSLYKRHTTGKTKIKQIVNIDERQQDATIEQSCDYSSLIILNMSKNKFDKFPTGLPCLAPNLIELNISDNRIQCIDVVFLPQSLRKLIAKNCMIQRIGNTLMDRLLKHIERRCYHTDESIQSSTCPHRTHKMLHNLQTLDLFGNEIQRIQLLQHAPLKRKTQDASEDETTYQQNITILKLLYPSLEGLNLSQNRLTKEFNPNIGRQTQLKWIRLSGNTELERLPLEIAHLKNVRSTLTELEIQRLPNLVEPPPEYHKPELQVGQILTYLRSKLKQ